MTLKELIDFCKTNNFEDYKNNLQNYVNNKDEKSTGTEFTEEEKLAIEATIEASKNLEFLYIKHFDSFEFSIYRNNNGISEDGQEIECTLQMLFITASGNTIPQGINFNKETLDKLNENEIVNISGKMVFKILADYGKMVGLKLLQTRKQIKENLSTMN